MDEIDLCIFCEREVGWDEEGVQCDMCDKWQHRLCYTGLTREQYQNLDFEFVCGPCQDTLQTEEDEIHLDDLIVNAPDIHMEDEALEFELVRIVPTIAL